MPVPEGWRPRLVALDLDGTVVAPDDTVPAEVVAAVGAVCAAGVPVVLSTGRSVHHTRPVAEILGIRSGWLVCSNGAVIATIDPPVVTDTVTFDAAPAVRLLQKHLPDALVAVEELGVGYRVTAPFPEGELAGEQIVMDVDSLVREPVTRVILRSPGEEPEFFLDVVAKLGLQDVSYAVGYTAWLDLAPKGVSKAFALSSVTRRLSVSPADVLAVGDGRNDVEMLEWAGVGAAMGHAPAELQDVADVVTGSFDELGLVSLLRRWFP